MPTQLMERKPGKQTMHKPRGRDSITFYNALISCLVFLIMTIVIAFLSYNKYKTSFYEYRNELCIETNALVSYIVEGDEIQRYSETLVADESYAEFVTRMDEIFSRIDAKYLYILFDNGVEGMYTYIYNANNYEEFGTPYALGINETKEEYDGAEKALEGESFEQALYYDDDEGYGKLYYAYAPIFNSNGETVAFIGIDVDLEPFNVNLAQFRFVISLTCFAAVLLFSLVTILNNRRMISKPLKKITAIAEQLSYGNVDIALTEEIAKSDNEIGQLARSFNKLANSIKDIINELRHNMQMTSSGRFDDRTDDSRYGGEFGNILSLVNSTHDIYCRHLDSLPEPIGVFSSANGKLIFGNTSMRKFLRRHGLERVKGSLLHRIVAEAGDAEFSEKIASMIDSDKAMVINSEISMESIDGVERFYAITILRTSNMHFEQENEKVLTMMLVDDTLLIAARKEAEQGSRSKSEFLSRMSHEMRTPMTAIIGMTDIARSSEDIDKKNYCLNRIDGASKHLLGVINDILDMSKIEADKYELNFDTFNFEKMLMKVLNVINYTAEEKKLNIIVNLNSNVPTVVYSDEQRISQVITNLLSNAVKFTPENGKIIINIWRVDRRGDEFTLQFEVIDNGIGIEADKIPKLFRLFEQADGGISRKFGGTGLGLAISKRLVELMDGRIWVESEANKGSKFTFTAVMKNVSTGVETKLGSGINKDNVNILAVDDAPEIREYFLAMMKEWDLPCSVAESSEEAIRMIEDCRVRPFNIFFIDWQMPGMDGIELSRHIKQSTKDNSIVIMISVAAWEDFRKEAEEAGVEHFVAKPLFPSALINVINECMGYDVAKNQIIDDDTDSIEGIFKGYTILLAEDVDVNREIISSLLEDTGLVIDYAKNGREAVDMFNRQPDRYDLILMDVHMPEMGGYEATRTIRALNIPKAQLIPIVAMTANVFKEDVDRCLAAGMNDHLGKPIDIRELVKKLKKYIAKSNNNEEKDGVSDMAEEMDYAILLPAIDVKDGMGRILNNKKLYFKLLTSFSGRKMADDIINAIDSGDSAKIAQASHALKGVSANLGLKELFELTLSIESQAKVEGSCEDFIGPLNKAVSGAQCAIETLLGSENA